MSESDDAEETSAPNLQVPWRRVGRVAGVLALVIVVVPFVVYAVPQVVGAQQSYVVLSGSMEPAMSPGDVIIVDGVDAAAVQEGAVITFGGEDGGTPTTHRVVEVVERENGVAFRTKGDANEDPDQQLVTPSQLEGRVMTVGGHLLVIPYIGYVIQFVQTTVGFVALFVIPLTLLVASELWNIVGSSKPDADGESVGGDAAMATEAPGEDDQTTANAAPADEDRRLEDASPASAANTTPDGGEAAENALTFSPLELQLGLGVLGAFLAYSLWVVYATVELFESGVIWASGVAAAVAVAFLLFLGLYSSGRRGGETEDPDPSSGGPPAAADGGENQSGTGRSPDATVDGETPTSKSADHSGFGDFESEPLVSESGGDDASGRDHRTGGGEADE
ncbi:signal peptidase I [Halobaculum gomorrense]|uniref:Signal peptidase, endoplasmic reticulum-type n=1 Tax=Halobaculum gomorrense TaxID=43928 RepID=A0A1M5UEV0_9EURY|nr:signal peptidase I [Halobaculum gomorrense]SHH61499.1 signal peptidase, endoplasmic reticulum-type [Halobaculum gomorrense]